MKNKLITAKEWLSDYDMENSSFDFEESLADYAKYCVKYALEQAAEKAKSEPYIDFVNIVHETEVDKNSIINSFDYNEIQ